MDIPSWWQYGILLILLFVFCYGVYGLINLIF